MKKISLASFILLAFMGKAFAEFPPAATPPIEEFVSEAVYQSTFSASANPVDVNGINTSVIISSLAVSNASLHTVNVTAAGTSSFLELWDCQVSTNDARCRLIASIDTTAKVSYLFDVHCSSGLKMHNRGTTPAAIQISYRERPKVRR